MGRNHLRVYNFQLPPAVRWHEGADLSVSGDQPYETVFFAQSFAEGVGSRAAWLTCAWESQLVLRWLLWQLGKSAITAVSWGVIHQRQQKSSLSANDHLHVHRARNPSVLTAEEVGAVWEGTTSHKYWSSCGMQGCRGEKSKPQKGLFPSLTIH